MQVAVLRTTSTQYVRYCGSNVSGFLTVTGPSGRRGNKGARSDSGGGKYEH